MDRQIQPRPFDAKGALEIYQCALLIALLLFGPVAAAQQTSWSQFRADPQLTGVSATALPADLKVMWTFDAGEAIESSAAIADGAVYVGSTAGELIALDLQTGAVRWRYQDGRNWRVVACHVEWRGVHRRLTGTFHAVDTKTGKGLWTFKTMGEIRSSPVVVGDRVLIGSYDRFLYALSAAKGEVAWKIEFQGYVHATPSVVDGVAYISGCDETFRGIRVADGREVLNIPVGAYMGARLRWRRGCLCRARLKTRSSAST